MKTIRIFKNKKCIKSIQSDEKSVSKTFTKCVDIAGGMWNGIDIFSVKIIE